MRKSLAGLLLFTAVLFGITSAWNIAVDENSSKSSCNSSETEEKYLYLRPWYTVSDQPRDTFWNTVDSMIKRGETSVQLWRNWVITDCSDWNTSSIVVPSTDTAMVVINRDWCDFQTPSYTKVNNPSAVDAQIHYTIWYARVWESWTKTYNGKLYYKNHWDSNWTCYPWWSKVSDNQSCPNTTVNYVDETKYHEWECINYHVFRCWDGLVNKPMGDATRYDNVTYNEECDPASPDWKNRTDWKSCNASCKIEYEASSCGSLNWTTAYNSNYSSPRLSESSVWLCWVGKVVAWSFSYNKTTWKYTWSCKNGNATAIACNAQDLWCGDWKVQSSYEACDPKDSTQAWWKEWSWKTCSSSCKIEDIPRTGPSCSSTYDKKTEYTSTSAAWLSSSDKLCAVWSLVSWSFGYSGTPRTFTWKCTNDWLDTTCNAYQQWCGDWKKNGNEVCDPQDTTNKSWWWDGCSTSCDKATYNKWVCGSTYHTKKTYMSIDTDRLTQYTQWLCDKWTVTNFKKHTSSHIYTWQCDNHWNISDTCWADQEWCGDWIKNGSETCDDGSKNGTSSSSCSATCTTVSGVSCWSQNWWTKYFSSKQTSPWLTKTSNWMCAAWLTVGTPEIKWTDSHLEWTCSNANWSSTTCKAYQEWCGDWVKNGSETCDEGSKNGTSSSSCSATCTAVSSVSCWTQNWWTKYFSSRQTSPWLTRTSNWMCSAWTVGTPEIKWTDSHLEWTCSNANWLSTTCKAYQEWCGDEILQSDYEECDYNDKNETNWWNDGCDTSCAQKNEVVSECDENNTFHRKLRQNSGYIFADRFNAGSADRRLYGNPSVKFDEKMDYNRGANPTFSWTTELVNNDMKVPQWKDMLIVESSPEYIVKDHPVKRTTDNLYVEYTVSYANKKYTTTPSSSQLKTHKECVYYEISRCWDGVLDEDYWEECDPGSEWTKVMPDWRICNADCKLVTVVTPLCNSEYNWQRVNKLDEGSYLCREWAITGFNYDTSTYKWTWKCHNVAWEVECRAIKPYCGDGILDEWEQCDYNDKNHTNWWNWTCNKSCQLEYPKWTAVIEKTLENKIPVDHEWQALTWIVKVTASWWDISNFEIWDKMPIELDYVGYDFDSAHSQSWVTVTYDKQRSPVRSWNVNIHYWNTTWTLHNWNSIVIKVNTTVNTMPRTWEDILNIACVIKDNKELDCGEDKPPRVKWTAVIEKTLENKIPVDHEWQALTWIVKVTASWWDISNFEIWDKMPIELDYVDYEFDSAHSQKWVTVTYNDKRSPVRSWNVNIHYWNTTWTLYNWNSIVIKVNTTVNTMPRTWEDILNIACVIKDNKELDCGEDKPPVKDGELEVIKTLISKDKYVIHTWQELEWSITVRAKKWDVKMESIKDKLPEELKYKEYTRERIPTWITVYEPTWTGGKEITWKTTWTLNSWDYIELHVVTTVIKMPQKTVKNVACAKPENWQEECNPWYTHDLQIIKYVWNNQNNKRDKAMTWKVWGTITYRIEFGNNWDESVRIKLKDYLPTWVRFISGTLVVWKQISTWWIGTWTFDMIYEWTEYKIDGVTINSYENIFLNKNEGGVLTIEWEILNDTKNTTNFACIFDENSENKDPIACSDAHHNIEPEKVMCSSNIPTTQQSKKICDGKSWITDEITCSSTWWVADIIEFLCDWTVQKSWTNISSLTWKCEFGPNATTHTVECRVNKSNTSVNNCTQKYVVTNGCGNSWWCFPAWTKVIMSDNTKKNIEDVQTGDIVLSYNTEKNINELSTVKQSIVHVDLQHEMYELTINGNVLKVTDVHPFYVRKSLSSKDYDWIEAQHLKVGDILLMNDGTLVTIEKINHYSNKETVYNLEVEGNHDYFVDMWYLVHNKDPKPNPDPGSYCDKHKDDPMCLFANPTCFNVNEWNVSIEMWEYLPFYLNVYKDDNQDTYSYYFVKEKDKDGECVSWSVDLGSLKCTYVIKGPAEWWWSQEVFTKTEDCLSSSMQSYKGSLKDWVDWQKENYEIDVRNDDAWVTYYPRIFTSKSKDWVIKDSKWDNIYWEYQFQISVSSFKQCMEWKWEEVPHTPEAICQSNFVLTEPYTVQKTPSWNLTASTDTLKKFRRVDWFKPFSDFISEISTTQYNKNAAVQTAMNNFITKYKKLAVEVNIDNSRFLKKGGNSVKVSKVPGKDIYFVDWDITIRWGTTSITKPFTLVQINGDTTIDGNVGHNMMLLTTWNIRFHWNCKSNQTVKWIFYAWNKLYRDWVSKNLDPDVGEWCDKWGLYVKWVLIWDNFIWLMDKSRSHLENWFKADENQKWSEIMKWWSVVIEYSPSVFTKSTMPPGAEDFTTALSIYKQ